MRYLLALTRDARYGDSMERVLYNTILGAWPVREDGPASTIPTIITPAPKPTRETFRERLPDGITMADGRAARERSLRIVADYTITAYFRASDGVYVNLYVPSRLTWTMNSVRCVLHQQTAYPTDSLMTMRLKLSSPVDFSLHLRIPAWAGRGTSVSVNGTQLKDAPLPGSFFALRRNWKSGDTVELDLDRR